MKVTCPSCQHQSSISIELVPEEGKSVTCPECKTRFPIDKPKISETASFEIREVSPAEKKRKMISRVAVAAVIIVLAAVAGFLGYRALTAKGEDTVKQEFIQVIKKHIQDDRRKEDFTITKETTGADVAADKGALSDGWRKYVEMDSLQYEYNIEKSDSITAPYTATYSYEIVRYVTALFPTKEAAFKSADYSYLKTVTHTLKYEYKNGSWVYKSDSWQ